jgi:transposase
MCRLVRAASNYHVVSYPETGRTNGSVFAFGGAFGRGFYEGRVAMEAIIERCCGLDVHKDVVVACVLIGPPEGRVRKDIRTYGTTTEQLEELRDWLAAVGCTHVGMESTGVYWVPVYTVLEEHFDLTVGNASHMKNVPGRKTDVKDSQWIAELIRCGLIRKSFVPPKWQRALRDLTRYRRKLVEAQASERNRLQRLLETCNVKLASVATDVFGKSGREMLRALIKGDESPEQMAQRARGRLRKKLEQLVLALRGKVESHHRFMLEMQLGRVEDIEANIAIVDSKIDEAIAPHRAVMQRLMTIPGVDRVVAVTVIAELGIDMNVFPTPAHAAAWGGVCPGNNESAGKRMGQQRRRGNVHLATALVQAAMAASKTKGTYLKARFWKIAGRAGKKRAAVAVAHSILNAIYHMLMGSVHYKDLGGDYLDRFLNRGAEQRLVQRLRLMGYEVRPKTA